MIMKWCFDESLLQLSNSFKLCYRCSNPIYDCIIQLLHLPSPGEHLKYSHKYAKIMPWDGEHTNVFWLSCYNISTVLKIYRVLPFLLIFCSLLSFSISYAIKWKLLNQLVVIMDRENFQVYVSWQWHCNEHEDERKEDDIVVMYIINVVCYISPSIASRSWWRTLSNFLKL